MEDFKRIVKMKTGGSVSKAIEAYEKRERKTEVSDDIAQDKSLIKKGVSQHESALHKGEPKTELKLKKGGRAKKEVGTVKKYKCGGGVYGAKKTAEDKKSIAAAKRCKPSMAEGGGVLDTIKSAGKTLYENVMGTPEQNKVAQEQINKQAKSGSKLAKFFGGKADAESAPVEKCGGGKMKRGGEVC